MLTNWREWSCLGRVATRALWLTRTTILELAFLPRRWALVKPCPAAILW